MIAENVRISKAMRDFSETYDVFMDYDMDYLEYMDFRYEAAGPQSAKSHTKPELSEKSQKKRRKDCCRFNL